jgi:hypothetical protein
MRSMREVQYVMVLLVQEYTSSRVVHVVRDTYTYTRMLRIIWGIFWV